jgi:hypothetical protein
VGTHTAMGRGYILATWIKAIGRALDAAGCNGAALLAKAGYDPGDLEGPTARCPLVNSGRLWELALGATGDPAFGLKVASHIKNTTFHAPSYGLAASSTLKEAFERVCRYCHVGSDAVAYEFFRCGADYNFVIKPVADLPFESIDALVAAHLRMCRSRQRSHILAWVLERKLLHAGISSLDRPIPNELARGCVASRWRTHAVADAEPATRKQLTAALPWE